MSAYQCENDHIVLLAVWSQKTYSWTATTKALEEIRKAAKILWQANVDAVAARYDEDPADIAPPTLTASDTLAWCRAQPIKVLKLAQGYEYQASEHPEWRAHEARDLVQAAKDNAIRCLEGYEEAPWTM